MKHAALSILPVEAPVRDRPFDLLSTLIGALETAGLALVDGDILALSSKYVAISQGRVVDLAAIQPGDEARQLAERYHMAPEIAQLVLDESEHIFGGIPLGFLLTYHHGVMSPNAGIDRSNIPPGQAVLLPADPYGTAGALRSRLREQMGVDAGVLITDSWLVPARMGTTGVAIACAGFDPVQDERGKQDLFGNRMAVTQVGIADSLSAAAQLVMGERDEATPFAILRGSGLPLSDAPITVDAVAIPWAMDIYVESLTLGLLPDGAPRESLSAGLARRFEGV
jgi:coenzyme F420-0:L-glutamate ligase / coenzyme F420-1:gamma-L-glutamate ligase